MKKTATAMLALAAGIVAASCQKEAEPDIKSFEPMTINAVSEGIGTATIRTMVWQCALSQIDCANESRATSLLDGYAECSQSKTKLMIVQTRAEPQACLMSITSSMQSPPVR